MGIVELGVEKPQYSSYGPRISRQSYGYVLPISISISISMGLRSACFPKSTDLINEERSVVRTLSSVDATIMTPIAVGILMHY